MIYQPGPAGPAGLSDKLKENFEKRVQVKRLEFNFKGISDPY